MNNRMRKSLGGVLSFILALNFLPVMPLQAEQVDTGGIFSDGKDEEEPVELGLESIGNPESDEEENSDTLELSDNLFFVESDTDLEVSELIVPSDSIAYLFVPDSSTLTVTNAITVESDAALVLMGSGTIEADNVVCEGGEDSGDDAPEQGRILLLSDSDEEPEENSLISSIYEYADVETADDSWKPYSKVFDGDGNQIGTYPVAAEVSDFTIPEEGEGTWTITEMPLELPSDFGMSASSLDGDYASGDMVDLYGHYGPMTLSLEETEPESSALEIYTVKLGSTPGNAEVSLYEETGDSDSVEKAEVQVTAAEGYEFDGAPQVELKGTADVSSPDEANGTYTFTITNIQSDLTVNVNGTVKEIKPAKKQITAKSADENQGTVTGSGEYEIGAEVKLEAAAKDGFKFKCWKAGETEVSQDAAYTFKLEDSSPDTYTACFEAAVVQYTITFDGNGGKPDQESARTGENGRLSELPEASRDGYDFEGWFTGKEDGDQVKAGETEFKQNTTLYAHWKKKEETAKVVKITFDANGGEVQEKEKETNAQGKLESLPEASRDGYDFEGWFTGKEDGDQVKASETEFKENTTLYAHWKKKEESAKAVKITFNANGGKVDEKEKETNAQGKLESLPTATRDGYEFTGWSMKESGGDLVKANETVFKEAATLYAQWKKVELEEFTVHFDANGGKVDPESVKTTDQKVQVYPTPTRENYTFIGWSTSKDSGKSVNKETKYTADTTLYARWKKNQESQTNEYTVTFDPNGGTVSKTSAQTTNQYLKSLPSAHLNGYVFGGWYTAAEGGTQVTIKTKITSNMTVYAHWTAKQTTTQYEITFDANGGEVSTTSMKTTNQKLKSLPRATREGYQLKGWYTQKDGGIKVTTGTKFEKDTTIYAQWEVSQQGIYTITFDSNDGSGKMITSKTEKGHLAGLPTPTREGYQFNGWYTDKEGGDKVDTSTVFKENTTLYAHWTRLTTANKDRVPTAAEGMSIWIWVGTGITAILLIGLLGAYFYYETKKMHDRTE